MNVERYKAETVEHCLYMLFGQLIEFELNREVDKVLNEWDTEFDFTPLRKVFE